MKMHKHTLKANFLGQTKKHVCHSSIDTYSLKTCRSEKFLTGKIPNNFLFLSNTHACRVRSGKYCKIITAAVYKGQDFLQELNHLLQTYQIVLFLTNIENMRQKTMNPFFK